jgi:hypothetical protein
VDSEVDKNYWDLLKSIMIGKVLDLDALEMWII